MSAIHSYGVVQVSGVHLGINISALIEAVEWPTDVLPHPTARGILVGIFTLRGKAVPLIDLRSFFAPNAVASGPTPLVAIIKYNGGYLGIAIDAVCEIVKMADNQRCTLISGDTSTGLFPMLLMIQDGQRMIYALDLAYLASLPEVVFATDPMSASQSQAFKSSGLMRHYLVFECDARHFCIDASVVTELVDKPLISPSDFGNERCFGSVQVRGKKVAALSLSHVLGFETKTLAAKDQLLLLTGPDGRVSGFGYDRMVAIRRQDPSSMLAVPTYGLREPDLLRGVMNLENGAQALLLAHESLLNRPEVQSYAKIFQHEVLASQSLHQAAKAVNRQACLLFHAPIHFAAPLNQITEILEIPAQHIGLPQPESHLLGQFSLRGEQIPLICLSSLIESSPQPPTLSSRVLIVRGNHSTFGFAVCKVDAIDSFKEFDPTKLEQGYPVNLGRGLSTNDRVRSLISIGNQEHSWRATLLDLRSLAMQLEAAR
ncbi:chemotaxis protein CheW [Pseudomonas asuensis]|uniref:Chemotaxis protein CheW n=1 Tax=Pseudomonas asuensis TaxID=1825787 RepID=A0ABQ2GYG9_9PSED|nr:chemotaxis protein CheW [Pseudomonas asuensis]GGM18409.1 chemotaxis protein CheW [Pseudomonas asuensis]